MPVNDSTYKPKTKQIVPIIQGTQLNELSNQSGTESTYSKNIKILSNIEEVINRGITYKNIEIQKKLKLQKNFKII